METYDFIVVGAGIFGVCTALELIDDGHSVCLINADVVPDPQAASTDISKVVRMEYGSDREYMEMAIEAMEVWRSWNELFGETLFHEVGYLLLCREPMEEVRQHYEWSSYQNVLAAGFRPDRCTEKDIKSRFPAFHNGRFKDGFYHRNGGFAESGRAVRVLFELVKQRGGRVEEHLRLKNILIEKNGVRGIEVIDGSCFFAPEVVLCTGNYTPHILPELRPFMKVTGHPVFHLLPSVPDLFKPDVFPVFAADISHTGYYGFPLHPVHGVVKVAKHSRGLELDPEVDERMVYPEDEEDLRAFLTECIPALADAKVVFTRRCCYTDTLDGHFWIDRHPDVNGLTVGSGGSGHGFKMGPVVGKMIASRALSMEHCWSSRYNWRHLDAQTTQREEARHLVKRTL